MDRVGAFGWSVSLFLPMTTRFRGSRAFGGGVASSPCLGITGRLWPNQAAAVNAPVAPRFQVGRPWRRVTEQRRWAIPEHAQGVPISRFAVRGISARVGTSGGSGFGPFRMTTSFTDSGARRGDEAFPSSPRITGRSWPNQAAAVNAPVAPRFQVGRHWRRVTEQRR